MKEVFKAKVPMVVDRLTKEFHLAPVDCFAILGNLGHESAGFEKLQEIKPKVKGSKGGFGWAQWTGPRRVAFEKWCSVGKLDPSSDEANLGFLVLELQTTERNAIIAVTKPGTLYEKVVAFEMAYERAGIKHYDSRFAWAQVAEQVWNGLAVPKTEDKSMLETVIPTILAPILRHALTALAGVLVTIGLLEPAQSDNFATIVSGIVAGLLGMGWSFAKNTKKPPAA